MPSPGHDPYQPVRRSICFKFNLFSSDKELIKQNIFLLLVWCLFIKSKLKICFSLTKMKLIKKAKNEDLILQQYQQQQDGRRRSSVEIYNSERRSSYTNPLTGNEVVWNGPREMDPKVKFFFFLVFKPWFQATEQQNLPNGIFLQDTRQARLDFNQSHPRKLENLLRYCRRSRPNGSMPN